MDISLHIIMPVTGLLPINPISYLIDVVSKYVQPKQYLEIFFSVCQLVPQLTWYCPLASLCFIPILITENDALSYLQPLAVRIQLHSSTVQV